MVVVILVQEVRGGVTKALTPGKQTRTSMEMQATSITTPCHQSPMRMVMALTITSLLLATTLPIINVRSGDLLANNRLPAGAALILAHLNSLAD
jgi:hypothetical protein